MKNQKAFTLLEMLLVIAIIAILAGIVIIAINPGRQLAQARNAQRASDLRALHSAVQQYYIDNKAWPTTTMPSDLTEVCDVDGNPLGCLDLSNLVPNYLPAIPTDPQATVGTNYQIAINPTSNTPELTAPSSTEYDLVPVQAGTTTLVATGDGTLSTLGDGLVAHYKMNDNAASAIVLDSTGNNNGTLSDGVSNVTSDHDVTGIVNGALSFDGSNDRIALPYNGWSITAGTVSLWLKPDSSQGLVGNGVEPFWHYNSGNRLYIGLKQSNIGYTTNYIIGVSGGAIQTTNVNWENDVWQHIVLTYDSGTATIYKNAGEQSQTVSYTNSGITWGTPYIGGIDAGRYFKGLIDDVRVYDRALNIGEIIELYNSGAGTEE